MRPSDSRTKRLVYFIISIALALCTTVLLSTGYFWGSSPLINGVCFTSFFYFFLFVFLYYQAMVCYQRRTLVYCYITSLLLASIVVFGAEFTATRMIAFKSPVKYFNILGASFLFCAILMNLFSALNRYASGSAGRAKRMFVCFLSLSDLQIFFIFAAVIALCFLPAFLAVYPGYFAYDALAQMVSVYTDFQLNDLQPVAHTLFMVFSSEAGRVLFGSYSVGLTLSILLQAVILIFVFAYSGLFLLRHKVPVIFVFLGILFLGLNPLIQIFAFTTTKDTLFSAFFLLCFLFIIEMLWTPETFYHSPRKLITFVLTAFLMCIMKKQGEYMLILMLPFLLFCTKKKNRRTCFLLFLTCLMSSSLFFGPIYKALNVESIGNVRETLSVPLQQIAAVMILSPESVTAEEKAIVNEVLDDKAIAHYTPEISDLVKNRLDTERFMESPMRYFKVWLDIGVKNPKTYALAFLSLVNGWFYPSVTTNHSWCALATPHPFEFPDRTFFRIHSLFPTYKHYLTYAGRHLFRGIPVLSATVCLAMPVWVMIILGTYLMIFKKWKFCISLLFPLTLLGSCILGPVYNVRYLLPLLILVPVMLCIPFLMKPDKKEQKILPDKS